ncbi:lysylphosphatidylglycerol synthase domain-containing protein [Oecophyllibacter saccharovorans]|uniref:lysylphosphatidylglycerol synthase domain-containing protein n=1 Tax=Oecophyllibacter saccharovorans TaxID=2558360 RepID=UPI00116E6F88|nr:lysylphosphatidylglycerol synthase domain-containing protein [Oecophyllibacter saccharovorans]TPW36738.1 lysylphosphatidylglycerol synthetase family protein [Oecophyllibacter saccharovorans]
MQTVLREEPPPLAGWKRLAHRLPALFGLLLLCAASFVIWRELKHLSVHDILASLRAIPASALWEGAAATFLSYFILSFYDTLACRCVGAHVPWRRTAFAAFCSYVLSHNLGCSAISGAAVRYRLYKSWGVPGPKIASIIAFCSLTYLLGTLGLVGLILLWQPQTIPLVNHLPPWVPRLAGGACFAALGAYLVLATRRREIRWGRFSIELPDWKIGLLQILVSMADVSATALIAWCVLAPFPPHCTLTFGGFLAIYLMSYTAGLVASVPGGLGVFDSSMLLALSPWFGASHIMGAVLVFRLFYYIIPLVLAGLMFAGHEISIRVAPLLARRGYIFRPDVAQRDSEADFSVGVAAGLEALFGVGLLLYALLVRLPRYPSWWHEALIQVDAFLLAVNGVVMIGLAPGLLQRVSLAWRLSMAVLLTTTLLLLLGGAAWWTYVPLLVLLLVLAPFRGCYYREAQWRVAPLSPSILAPLSLWLMALAAMGWIAHQHHVGLLWWQGLLHDAPAVNGRWFLAISGLFCLLALWCALRRSRVQPLPWLMSNAASYACLSDDLASQHFPARTALAPSGIIQDETHQAAIAFVPTDIFVLGLGTPVGSERYRVAAIWQLRDYAEQLGRKLAILQADESYREVYADLGLNVGRPIEGGWVFCSVDGYERLMQILAQFSVVPYQDD